MKIGCFILLLLLFVDKKDYNFFYLHGICVISFTCKILFQFLNDKNQYAGFLVGATKELSFAFKWEFRAVWIYSLFFSFVLLCMSDNKSHFCPLRICIIINLFVLIE